MKDFLAQAAKLLKKNKQYRRQMVVFLCLAVVVTFGTVTALKLYGQAMTHQVEVLDCQYKVHEHTEECYDRDENGNLGTEPLCGYALYVIHTHNDACYDAKGNLVCTLEEHEKHEHTEECYLTEKVLVCGLEETEVTLPDEEEDAEAPEETPEATVEPTPEPTEAPVEETPAPTPEPTVPEGPICGMEPHVHGEGCYEDTIVCGFAEEHVHGEGCATQTLTCTAAEHAHGEGCTDEEGNLTCTLEEHAHQEGCYTQEITCGKEEHTHTEACHAQNLVCALAEHEHTESCYAQAPAAPAQPQGSGEAPAADGSGSLEECDETGEGHIHTDECYEEVTTLICGEQELHTHDDSCYDEECFDEEGKLIEGSRPSCGLLQLEEHMHTQECFKTVELTPEEVAALDQGAKLHIHTEECYDEEGNLVCGHDATHIHMPECYDDGGQLICGYGTAVHVHEAKCYDAEGNLICGYETASHVHEDSCYDAEGNLQCGYETATHVHGKECYDEEGNLICGYEAAVHVHEDSCYDADGNLICGYGTASDTEDTVTLDGTFTYEAEDYTLEIHVQTDVPAETQEPDAPVESTTDESTTDEETAGTEEKVESGSEAEAPGTEEGSSTEPTEAEEAESQPVADDNGEESGEEPGQEASASGIEELSEVHEGDTDTTAPETEESQEGDVPEDTNPEEAEGQPEQGAQILIADEASGLTLKMSPLDAEEEIYAEMSSFIEGTEGSKLLNLSVMELHVYRNGKEIDIAGCTVAVNITPKAATAEEMVEAFGEEGAAEEDAGIMVSALQKTADGVRESGSVFLTPDMAEVPVLQNAVAENGVLAIARYVGNETITKTCTGKDFIVTATYKANANIPAEAELLVEQITEESDSEHYAERQAEYQEALEDDKATMRALMKIGFYVNGQEVEPQSPVTITIQFLDENGLEEGKPITVIHFANDGIEKLDGSEAKDNSTTFQMESFSEIAIGYNFQENTIKGGKLYISNDFECDVDPFHIVFHVEGEPKTMDGKSIIVNLPQTEGTEGEGTGVDSGVTEEESIQEGEDSFKETENIDGADTVTDAEDSVNLDAQEVKFHINFMDEDSGLREALMGYIGESTEMINRNIIHLISYRLTYGETELDISDCAVTVEITLGTFISTENGEGAFNSGSEGGASEAAQAADSEPNADMEVSGFIVNDSGEGQEEDVTVTPQDSVVISNADEVADTETIQTLKGVVNAEDADTEVSVTAIGVSEDRQMSTLGQMTLNGEIRQGQMDFPMNSGIMALAEESTSNPSFQVQYYAYVQKMPTTDPGNDAEAIKIIDTVKSGQDGVLGGAQLPSNEDSTIRTRNMYVRKSGNQPSSAAWPAYDPVYVSKDSTDSLTKIYTADLYEYRDAAGGLDHINKFAKDGLNYDLCEVWVLQDKSKVDNTGKAGWTVYSGDDISKLVFRNNNVTETGKISVWVTKDTVIRLVGRSNKEENKSYPTRFFDYDFTDGTKNHVLQGINHPSNYKKNSSGTVIQPRYGFGNNSSGATGLKDDQLNGYNINIARTPAKTIIQKCSFGLVENALSAAGYPQIKANAPDLFNPQVPNVKGRTEVTGRSLIFNRDGDTYTLASVAGSVAHAQNLDQFQKRPEKAYGTEDQIWTNQFWPMDNAPTFGDTANGHDPKFGTAEQHSQTELAESDDGKEHNSFFGMNFEVEFELTDDYVGPLNYYFFGDDDMWVFLEKPDGSTQLICDIGGVHQAAGEYVDLWNYIQKPADNLVKNNASGGTAEEGRVNPKYKLKFFYTERGASGSTCWMQFTLPSVNAVPVIDYTGNVKSTLTMGKTVDGEPTDERFDFTIEFSGDASNIATNDYPYVIKKEDGSLVESGDIRSGGTFKLGHKETIEVFNLPDGTNYTIKEKEYVGYEPGVGSGSTGTITKDKTVEGNIDWDRDDIVNYINKEVEYQLPETGGSGTILYTMAGAIVLLGGAGLMYRKKFRERRA